jgi:enterochelin esterase family protein
MNRSLGPFGATCAAVLVLGVVLGVAVAGPTTRPSVRIAPAVSAGYLGKYQLEPEHVLTISRFRDQLYGHTTDDPAHPLLPLSETRFSFDEDAVVTIEKDAAGKVTGARYERGDFRRGGPKISDDPREEFAVPDVFDSPRIAALAAELKRGHAEALKQFWAEMQDKTPLIEPFDGDARSSWVTFVYRGDAGTRTVKLDGGPLAWSYEGLGQNLVRLVETDLWYRTVRVPNDARFIYLFATNMNRRLPDDPKFRQRLYQQAVKADPLNPKFVHADSQGDYFPAVSVLEMPQAPPQPYVMPVEGNPKGTVVECKVHSELLKQERNIAVYTPPGYDKASRDGYPLLVLFDGHGYRRADQIPAHTIVDNLVAAKKIAPPVIVFVDAKDRQKELDCSESFAAFVAKELVPWARLHYGVTSSPADTIIGGLSLGGVMASYCALHHSDVFGNVLSQSGAFWVYPGCFDKPSVLPRDGALAGEFLKSPRLPIRFYLEAGRFENFAINDLLGENRRMRDVLLAKGYDVTYSEFSGGHHFISWRGSLADGLIALALPVK